MHSFLISSKNKTQGLEKALEITNKNKVGEWDVTILSSEKTIGIAEVREIQKKLSFKPIKSEQKAVIIDASTGITVESQNALLKSLEEPPANTIIILLVEDKESVLATIVSRCQIIDLNLDKKSELEDIEKYQKVLKIIVGDRLGKKVKLAQEISKNKDEALTWLSNMTLLLRKNLIESVNSGARGEEAKNVIRNFDKAYRAVKNSNVNLRLTLETLFLSV